jgi:pre-rRNA-processing protein TSR4
VERDGDGEVESEDDDELVIAMAATTLEESTWTSAPSYPPLYLSTIGEYLPPPPKAKLPSGVKVDDSLEDGKTAKEAGWAPEIYENSMHLDQVFERFAKRVSYEGEQCIR